MDLLNEREMILDRNLLLAKNAMASVTVNNASFWGSCIYIVEMIEALEVK